MNYIKSSNLSFDGSKNLILLIIHYFILLGDFLQKGEMTHWGYNMLIRVCSRYKRALALGIFIVILSIWIYFNFFVTLSLCKARCWIKFSMTNFYSLLIIFFDFLWFIMLICDNNVTNEQNPYFSLCCFMSILVFLNYYESYSKFVYMLKQVEGD